jgi:hypothetical protein
MRGIIAHVLIGVSGLVYFFGDANSVHQATFMVANAVFLIVSTKD